MTIMIRPFATSFLAFVLIYFTTTVKSISFLSEILPELSDTDKDLCSDIVTARKAAMVQTAGQTQSIKEIVCPLIFIRLWSIYLARAKLLGINTGFRWVGVHSTPSRLRHSSIANCVLPHEVSCKISVVGLHSYPRIIGTSVHRSDHPRNKLKNTTSSLNRVGIQSQSPEYQSLWQVTGCA
ncbi:hypothetical protein BDR06DRAFT_349954 [Suillus hirtellus]|nr:hypothetical protein BDR06DRAFT_349954 [Suillus hirtellus]